MMGSFEFRVGQAVRCGAAKCVRSVPAPDRRRPRHAAPAARIHPSGPTPTGWRRQRRRNLEPVESVESPHADAVSPSGGGTAHTLPTLPTGTHLPSGSFWKTTTESGRPPRYAHPPTSPDRPCHPFSEFRKST